MKIMMTTHGMPMDMVREIDPESAGDRPKTHEGTWTKFFKPRNEVKKCWYGGMHAPSCMFE